MMTHDEMMGRLEMMARGDGKWDLSPNDCQALRYVLKWTRDLQMVCDNRGRREEKGRERIAELEKAGMAVAALQPAQHAKTQDEADLWATFYRVINKRFDAPVPATTPQSVGTPREEG